MFERFTKDARMTVIDAQAEAVRQDAREIDATHLLHALLSTPGTTAALLLERMGVPTDELVAELANVRRRGGISDTDAAALDEFGIDIDQIVDKVEQAHGEYALAGGGVPKRRRWFGTPREHRPFSAAAKQTLEQTLKEALDLGDPYIGTEHLLLALAARPGPPADVLAARGLGHLRLRHTIAQDGR